jgi:hypothetical protein
MGRPYAPTKGRVVRRIFVAVSLLGTGVLLGAALGLSVSGTTGQP